MRVLVIFCDMLRANKLSVYNSKIECKTPFDDLLLNLGGTLFTRCFSPAPDTPRSLACLYTGLMPKENGCSKRIHWPRYYLNKNCTTIFDRFEDANINVHTNISPAEVKTGMLPERANEFVKNYGSFQNLLANKSAILADKNSLTFLNLQDYHIAIDRLRSSSFSDRFGQRKLVEIIKLFFKAVPASHFDEIIIMSDHGCMLNGDCHDRNGLDYIGNDRSQIVLFNSFRGASRLKFDDTLMSICDVSNVILHPFGLPLLNKLSFEQASQGRNHVAVEDYQPVNIGSSSVPCLWRVIGQEFDYYTNLVNERIVKKGSCSLSEAQIKLSALSILNSETAHFTIQSRELEILQYYEKLKFDLINRRFSDDSSLPNAMLILKAYFYVLFDRIGVRINEFRSR